MLPLPKTDFAECAKEVVCVSIGVNLLLPAVQNILKPLANAFDASPDKVVNRFFKKDREYCTDSDIQAIGLCAQLIEKDKGRPTIRLRWVFLDVCFATAGVVLLWTGMAGSVNWMSIFLFAPAVLACGLALHRWITWQLWLLVTILCVKWFARMRRKAIEASRLEKAVADDRMHALDKIGAQLKEAGITSPASSGGA